MTRFGLAVTATFLVAASGQVALAQSSGPAEVPPNSYAANQYVDSTGCAYIRAGIGGNTNWVPRLKADRSQMCGLMPSLAPRPAAPTAVASAAPQQQTQTGVAASPTTVITQSGATVGGSTAMSGATLPGTEPARTMTGGTMTAVAPSAPMAPGAAAMSPAAPAPAGVASAPAQAPVPLGPAKPTYGAPMGLEAPGVVLAPTGRVVTYGASGQTVQVRSAGGTRRVAAEVCAAIAAGHVFVYADTHEWVVCPGQRQASAAPAGPRSAPPTERYGLFNQSVVPASNPAVTAAEAATIPTPPQGYRTAWTDDRLNPHRGPQPAALVPVATGTSGGAVSLAAATGAASGGYVQVGTFGQPSNAQGTAARLMAMGLPAATGRVTQGGRSLTVVMAGPFANAQTLATALQLVRGSGFSDAYVRR